MMGSEEVREGIREMRVGDRMESDHYPIEVKIGSEEEMGEGGGKREMERSMESGEM